MAEHRDLGLDLIEEGGRLGEELPGEELEEKLPHDLLTFTDEGEGVDILDLCLGEGLGLARERP